jgi:hypothetical protein
MHGAYNVKEIAIFINKMMILLR